MCLDYSVEGLWRIQFCKAENQKKDGTSHEIFSISPRSHSTSRFSDFKLCSLHLSPHISWVALAFFFLSPFLGKRNLLIFEAIPASGMVVRAKTLLNSSSEAIASWINLGVMIFFPFSRATSPASSSISQVRYSRTAAVKMPAPVPMEGAYLPSLNFL